MQKQCLFARRNEKIGFSGMHQLKASASMLLRRDRCFMRLHAQRSFT